MTSGNCSYFTGDVINADTSDAFYHDILHEMNQLVKPFTSSAAIKLHITITAEQIQSVLPMLLELSKKFIDGLVSLPSNELTFRDFLYPFGLFEGTFSTLSSSLDFPQYVATTSDTRGASVNATKAIDNFRVDTYMRKDLFNQFRLFSESEEAKSLKGENKRFLDKIVIDFKRNGLFLEAKQYEKLKELKKTLAALSVDFSQALNEDKTCVYFSKEELEGCPKPFFDTLDKVTDDSGVEKYKVTMKYPDLFGVLQYAVSSESRKRIDVANNTRCQSNAQVLFEMIHIRKQIAEILGYPDHATYVVEEKMVKKPSVVVEFLDDLTGKLRPLAEQETITLRKLKAKETGQPFDSVVIESHDFKYYHRILEEQNNIDTNVIREYFEFSHVSREMFKIYEETLGVVFTKVPEDPKALWHPDVELYQVNEKSANGSVGNLIGHFYLDLFPRDGKYTHAACFDLQRGFVLENRQQLGQVSLPMIDLRQLPCAVMVTNFSKPSADRPSLLDHDEVVTYFHEFGHVMHTILSKTTYSRFHGCSVEGDFVEAPSQMLENWCYVPSILSCLSAHYKDSSKQLPDDIILALRKSKLLDVGLLTLRQIFFGRFDFALHAGEDIPKSKDDMIRKWKELRLSVVGIKETDDLSFFGGATFGHIAGGYDAGYYGYLWSLVVSCDMFYSRFFNEDKLMIKSEVGRDYRMQILQPGYSRDAMETIQAFLGRSPSNEAFLKYLGLSHS